jgi:hypothetical protein
MNIIETIEQLEAAAAALRKLLPMATGQSVAVAPAPTAKAPRPAVLRTGTVRAPSAGSAVEMLTRAVESFNGENFTAIDLRDRARSQGAGREQLGNTAMFLKRRVARDELAEIEHNGTTFYCRPKPISAANDE